MADLPEPLVSAEVDLRGFSGFMLDVDRLLASELVALGTPAECWSAVLLWCRAWKQTPPASLPDDDRVLAAFSGAGRNWPKVKATALRGFIKCSDGRLYHRVLAKEANEAWERRRDYQEGREQDRLRLKDWREKKRAKRNSETPDETVGETYVKQVSEHQRNGPETSKTGTGNETGTKEERKKDAAASAAHPVSDQKTDYYRRVKEVIGGKSGGIATDLLTAKGGSVAAARSVIETASTKADAREYLMGVINKNERDDFDAKRAKGEAW